MRQMRTAFGSRADARLGMHLDTPTLFLMTSVVTFVVGVLFLLSWSQARDTGALAIWGIAHIVGAGASALLGLRTVISDDLSIGLANALLLCGYGLTWSGVRAFEGRSPAYLLGLAGSAVWSGACLVPSFYGSLPARVALASSLAGLFCALSAIEIWRGRGEVLVSRYSAIVIMAAYAVLYWARVPLVAVLPLPRDMRSLDSPWFAVICFTATLFTIAVAFVFMALTKERAEHQQRLAAETDLLTGLPNRRAFVARASVDLADRRQSVALLLFDLDHFKAINDTYGHAVGDGVLIAFGHAAGAVLPPGARLGRMGGEEFACILPGLDTAAAVAVAERVRVTVADVALADYPRLYMRVSVGVAVRRPGGAAILDDLLRRADAALYHAKQTGRNRVSTATEVAARIAA